MRRSVLAVVAGCAVVGLSLGTALSARSGQDAGDGDFAIYVSPGTIAKSAQCNWVTVHTDVPYRSVEDVSAAANGAEIDVAYSFPDDRGNLVAKLRFDDVCDHVAPPSAVIGLTLVVNGQELSASETVAVRD